jgi:acyl dehydratase
MAVPVEPGWEDLLAAVGTDLGVSPAQVVDQAMVDAHSATTGDAQWIHDDTERTWAESPFGGPIVQGFLLLSLLTAHSSSFRFPRIPDLAMMVNYGFDRVRFLAPVPVGAAVQVRATLVEVTPKGPDRAVLAAEVAIEHLGRPGDDDDRAGRTEPVLAVAARWLFLAGRG